MLIVLTLVNALNLIDRQILSILAEQVKADLVLTDTQLGLLYGTLFAIFYSIFAIPLGRLIDNWRRVWVLAIGIAFWSLMTVLSGLADSYAGLGLARMGVGVGEATAVPAAFALVAVYLVQRRRALAMSIFQAGVFLGMGLSLVLGGWISTAWNAAYPEGGPLGLAGWQASFIIIGAPGLLMAALVLLTLREPPRWDAEGKERAVDGKAAGLAFLTDIASLVFPFTLWRVGRIPGALPKNLAMLAGMGVLMAALSYLTGDTVQWVAWGFGIYGIFSWTQTLRFNDPPMHKLIWGRPTVPLALLATGCLAVITYCVGFWTAPYAIRTFGMSAGDVGLAIGIPGAVASAIGVIGGGVLSDAWKRRSPRGRVWTCMVAGAAPIPAILVTFNAPDYNTFLMLAPLGYFAGNLWLGSMVAILQDVVLPRMFGTVGACYLLGTTMIGLALGPYLSGKIATVTGSLQAGVFSIVVAPALGIVVLWMLSRQIEQAEQTKLEAAREAGEAAG